MLSELLQQQRRFIDHYFDKLDLAEVDRAFQECLNTKGLIIFTGVGKSGIIAEKIAMTMISTGTKALYLPPTNFLHGDIGILSENDLFVLMSRSGETEELLNLVPFAKKRGTRARSRLQPSEPPCQAVRSLGEPPVREELCPFDSRPRHRRPSSSFWRLTCNRPDALQRLRPLRLRAQPPFRTIGKKIPVTVDDLMFKGEQSSLRGAVRPA